MDSYIKVEIENSIGTIILNRPNQLNAINYAMWGELKSAANKLSGNDAVRVVIIRGAGTKAFSSGADIKDFPAHRSSSVLAREYAMSFEGALDAVEQMPQPTISMIQGICIGGGCELSMATDIRIANTSSIFAVPVAKIGVLVGYNEMRRLVQLVGRGHASNLLLTARKIDGHEALRIGLITDLVESNEIEKFTYQLASDIANYAPLTQSGHKKIMQSVLKDPALLSLSEEEKFLPLSIFDTYDGMEGYRAFVEKRLPKFTGT